MHNLKSIKRLTPSILNRPSLTNTVYEQYSQKLICILNNKLWDGLDRLDRQRFIIYGQIKIN